MTTYRLEEWQASGPLAGPDIDVINEADVLDAALTYAELGWMVFPVDENKAPVGRLVEHGFLDASSDPEVIRGWWAAVPNAGIGVATGKMSGVVVVDLDGPTGRQSWANLRAELGIAEDTLRQATGRYDGGRHLFYVAPERPLPNGVGQILGPKCDFRGDGGYVVLAPTLHKSGKKYQWESAGKGILPFPQALIERWDDAQIVRHAPTRHLPSGSISRPGDDFNRRSTWPEILEPHGWQCVRNRGDEIYWRRPGKERGTNSATENYMGSDVLYVFSEEAQPFVSNQSYSKFAAYALLNHNNDFATAARALGEAGYGSPLERAASAKSTPVQTEVRRQSSSVGRGARLLWGNDIEPARPCLAWGNRLVIGGLNLLAGDGGLGKSTLAAIIARAWTDGGHDALPDSNEQFPPLGKVIIASYEDSKDIVRKRADVLDLSPDRYAVIEGARDHNDDPLPFGLSDLAEVRTWVQEDPDIGLLIIDPWTEFLNDNDNDTAPTRRALGALGKLAEETGLTVIILAHVNKSSEVTRAVDKVKGSRELTNRVRSVLFVVRDPNDPATTLLAHIKANLSAPALALAYRWLKIEGGKGWFEGANPFSWLDGTRDLAETDMFRGAKPNRRVEMQIWLRQELSGGDKKAQQIRSAAIEAGHAGTTFDMAVENVVASNMHDGEEWWCLK